MNYMLLGSFALVLLLVIVLFWIRQSFINKPQNDQEKIQKTIDLCKKSLNTIDLIANNLSNAQKKLKNHKKQQFEINICSKCMENINKQKQNANTQQLLQSPKKQKKNQQKDDYDPITMSFKKLSQTKRQNQSFKNQFDQAVNELQFCRGQLQESQKNQIDLRQKIFKILEQLHGQRTEFNRIIDQYSKQLQEKNAQIKSKQNHIRNLVNQNQHLKVKTKKSELLIDSPSKSSLLSNSRSKGFLTECRFILDQQRQFLIRHFKNLNLNISKSQLLFKLDKLHPKNPHLQIDGIKNILLIIQLTNGKALAAFSSQAYTYQVHNKQKEQSFLFDLSRKKVFTGLKECIKYDDRNLVWGQQALMIKQSQPKVLFSNLQKTSYWDRRTTNEQFLGTPRNWAQINLYQIHQIQFQI